MCKYIGDMSGFWMVEIGSYVGDSTEIFANNVDRIFCVDPWENGYDENDGASSQHPMSVVEKQFDELRKQYNNITKLKMTGDTFVEVVPDGFFDLVYIDGLHTYEGEKNDIQKWLPKIKKGGFIAGHDYGSKHFPGVKKAVDELLNVDVTFRDSSWLVRV